ATCMAMASPPSSGSTTSAPSLESTWRRPRRMSGSPLATSTRGRCGWRATAQLSGPGRPVSRSGRAVIGEAGAALGAETTALSAAPAPLAGACRDRDPWSRSMPGDRDMDEHELQERSREPSSRRPRSPGREEGLLEQAPSAERLQQTLGNAGVVQLHRALQRQARGEGEELEQGLDAAGATPS